MEKLFNDLKLSPIKNIEPVDSSQNTVFKVTTIDNEYLLKKYSHDAIKDVAELQKRKQQIEISKTLSNSGIPTIIPIEFNGEYFIDYNNHYYLIYNYFEYKTLEEKELNNNYIKILSNTLASMHKLNLKSDLPIQYRNINIDYENYLNKFKDNIKTQELYKLMNDNKKELIDLINNCNNSLPKINENLCISHNDYKLKNILWNNDNIYLIDFDATSLSNPAVSLAESAFALSKQNNNLNITFYKTYIKEYLHTYGLLNTNYNDALNCAMNGKLQWYEYLLSNCDSEIRIQDSISMTKELLLFINTKDEQIKIYNDIIYRIN